MKLRLDLQISAGLSGAFLCIIIFVYAYSVRVCSLPVALACMCVCVCLPVYAYLRRAHALSLLLWSAPSLRSCCLPAGLMPICLCPSFHNQNSLKEQTIPLFLLVDFVQTKSGMPRLRRVVDPFCDLFFWLLRRSLSVDVGVDGF